VAVIRKMELRVIEKDSPHTDAECTYSIVDESDGTKVLQIDTYGSPNRRFPGKVSQSIRFSPQALDQLKKIIEKHFSD
jgi:hypothetical protein